MFFVCIDPGHTNNNMHNTREINNAIVKVEAPLNRNEMIECHRCQMFKHTIIRIVDDVYMC